MLRKGDILGWLPGGLGSLGDLAKRKEIGIGQTLRPVTGNLTAKPMESKIFSGAEREEIRNFIREDTARILH